MKVKSIKKRLVIKGIDLKIKSIAFLYIGISIFLLNANSIYAQDAHFSQWDLISKLRNPASLAEMTHTDIIGASYRTQWMDISPAPFRNIHVDYRKKFKAFHLGGNILHNDAGEASLQSTRLLINGALQKTLSENGDFLAAGVGLGVVQQRFDAALFQFDNQFTAGIGYDESQNNGESFLNQTKLLPEFSAGAMLRKSLNKLTATVGLSFAHINRAKSNYLEDQIALPMLMTVYGNIEIPVKERLKGQVHLAYGKQDKATEKMVGIRIKYKLESDNQLLLGIGTRLQDAFIIEAGIEMKKAAFTISYDANNSALVPASNSRGAIELSASYYFNKIQKEKPEIEEVLEEEPKVIAKEEIIDTDNDKVPDHLDECPTIPGIAYFNGCNDSDRDGVWDSRDACPNLFGDPANQGCPIHSKDSDGDGLIDAIDVCPFLRGLPEYKGCPDTDNDKVSDNFDHCPFLKGDINNNGCPIVGAMEQDARPAKMMELDARPAKMTKEVIVEFDINKYNIKPVFYSKLDGVIEFLYKNPETTIFLSGHTDQEGSQEFNYHLGQNRSKAVMEYFVQKGISGSRISTISYGEIKPKETNDSDYGKARNRRVEIFISRPR